MQFDIEPYSKEQHINDNGFNDDKGPWSEDKQDTGLGTFRQYSLEDYKYGRTRIRHLYPNGIPGFRETDYAYWVQDLNNINSGGLEIQKGKLYQENDESKEDFNNFTENPYFYEDLNYPYGEYYNPGLSEVLLDWEEGAEALVVDITPSVSTSGGSPSAAWWYYIDIPYEADYAQITISWAIDEKSDFEELDEYQVIARINNRYIDGTKWISKDDSLPMNGSENALIIYDNPNYLDHEVISRTYNITDLIDGLVGINKFDFGVWAKNPTHGDDKDQIIAKFHSIEIIYNTSNKYEVAYLEFDYKCIDDDAIGFNPFTFSNDASMSLFIKNKNTGANEVIRVLPFSKMIISDSSFYSTPWEHVNFSLSQKYQEILMGDDLEFKIGVVFERDYYDRIYYFHYIDNVYFKINYKHPVNNPQLRINIDNNPSWEVVYNNLYAIDTSSWVGGGNHNFQFKTNDNTYQDKLYLNFKSELKVNLTNYIPNGAYAKYDIGFANSKSGSWNITYNNTFSYSKLAWLNSTPFFDLSTYSISFIDLPALDLKGSNSNNWEVFNAISPDLLNFTHRLSRFNYTFNPNNQSARITDAFSQGNWMLQARQPNYIINCSFNESLTYLGTSAFYKNELLQYNFTLAEDSVKGNYSVAILNSTGDIMNAFPEYYSSTKKNVINSIVISEDYKVGKYYILIKWNDTANLPGKTLRFGSIIKDFYVINATKAGFISTNNSVLTGQIANFSIFYRTYAEWGINSTLTVKENSTGDWKIWGKAWSDINKSTIVYLAEGNYSIKLFTDGAPTKKYTIKIICEKQYHQIQVLNTYLNITAEKILKFEITNGAYFDIQSQENIIDPSNIPFVNDTVNSIIQINLTDEATGNPIVGGSVIGNIGESDNYFEAIEVDPGIYNLTLDTTGLNATVGGENVTLSIKCSKDIYDLKELNVTIFINKIPTEITLQNINPVYAEGEISIIASMFKKLIPENLKPNNKGNLTYYIYNGSSYQESSYKLSGSLEFLMNGVYAKDVSLSGLPAGEYRIYINGTAFNCEDDKSNEVDFMIIPQNPTKLEISVPEPIRILKDFQIKTTLSYKENNTRIINQIIYLDISVGEENPFTVTTQTNSEGISVYEYIIASEYKDENITIKARYGGQEKIAGCEIELSKTIQGKIPIILEIIEYPNSVRVGYSAFYRVKIDIKDIGENPKNRMIFFFAYYDNEISNPFATQQLYTDENRECGYTISEIADEKENITVYFEYLGSTKVAYNSTFRNDTILPKWNSNFVLEDLPEIIRFGQVITFYMTFSCVENSSISLSGLSVLLIFKYGSITEIYIQYLDGNNIILFNYQVANEFNGDLNITIDFLGSNKINGYYYNFIEDIKEKIEVNIDFVEKPEIQYMLGSYYFSVEVTDENGIPLEDLKIIFEILDSNGKVIYEAKDITNEDGIASVSLKFEEIGDKFTIRVKFAEEGTYSGSEITSENIRVVNELVIFLDLLPYILLIIVIITAVAFSLYRGVIIPKRNRERDYLKKIYQKLSDAENIQHILILTKGGGVPVFSKNLADVPIDDVLVAGFLSAISSFGMEIGSKIKKSEGGLEELSYRQFIIIINEGKYVRIALLLLKRSSDTLKQKLKKFNEIFEEINEKKLKEYCGEVFDDIATTKLIEEIFEVELLYPHQVFEDKVRNYIKNLSKKDLTKRIIIIAKGPGFESNFYLRDMINHLKTMGIEEIKSFQSLETLKADKIVFAINPRTNYLIEELEPIINLLEEDDKNVLFAMFDGMSSELTITKYLKKHKIELSTDIEIILKKLKKINILDENNNVNVTGSAIATLLKLFPDL